MNDRKFDELMKINGKYLGQHPVEWRCFLEFVDMYFRDRNIMHPIVVEIGVLNNAQKPFYRELLEAEHIGIDTKGKPDILGNSRSDEVWEKLNARLDGRLIDLLFIDGDHTYAGVMTDYKIYGPLTQHIIAVHDIGHVYTPQIPEETMRFWHEIIEMDKGNIHIAIQYHNSAKNGITADRQMGIGLIIKGGRRGLK